MTAGINKDEFFREATLKLCGHIDFEEALLAITRFLRNVMPVDRLFLQISDPSLKSMRIIAIASPEACSLVNRVTPLSDAAIAEMWRFAEELKRSPRRHVWLFPGNPYDQALTREIAEFNDFTITSLMVMPLGLARDRELVGQGSIVLLTEGKETFGPQDAEMLSLLWEPFAISMSNTRQHREVLKLRDRLAEENRELQRELLRISGDEIIGADFGLRTVMQQVQKVAPTQSPVLLTGETGVGKDVVANAIHLASPRRDGPFVSVNCGAIAESMIDSELFGHERGAFTGAIARKRGRFERAHGGTLMLDEIGEMPLEAQVRLLRALQHREIERVGGAARIAVDIRVIAATNRDLPAMVREGRFRQDLFFRLNVFPIVIPPLRDRRNDIPALVQYFVERKSHELKVGSTPRLAPGAIDQLMKYEWPGNVRELENIVERAMILWHGDGPLRFDDLGAGQDQYDAGAAPLGLDDDLLDLDAVTAQHIRRVLSMAGGKIHGPGGAGELLGVNPNTLRYRMQKLGIAFKKPHAKH